MTSSSFRFVSWNWCVFTTNRDQLKIELLRRLEWDVCALQEVGPESFERIGEAFPGCSVISGQALADGHEHPDADDPDYGCALFVSASWEVLDHGLVPVVDHDGEWRTGSTPIGGSLVWASLRNSNGTEVDVVSGHPPHAAGTGEDRRRRVERKVRTYSALETWLNERRDRNVVAGLDGNCWIDACEDLYGTPTDPEGEQWAVGQFFHNGPERHGLRDTFRAWLEAHPERMSEIRKRRPHGPLAVTFVRGTVRKFGERFDAVMASERICVVGVEHSYEDAVVHGSDHSYVHAQLTLPKSGA